MFTGRCGEQPWVVGVSLPEGEGTGERDEGISVASLQALDKPYLTVSQVNRASALLLLSVPSEMS